MDHEPLSNTHRPEVVDGLASSHTSESQRKHCVESLPAHASDSSNHFQTNSSVAKPGVEASDDAALEKQIHARTFGGTSKKSGHYVANFKEALNSSRFSGFGSEINFLLALGLLIRLSVGGGEGLNIGNRILLISVVSIVAACTLFYFVDNPIFNWLASRLVALIGYVLIVSMIVSHLLTGGVLQKSIDTNSQCNLRWLALAMFAVITVGFVALSINYSDVTDFAMGVLAFYMTAMAIAEIFFKYINRKRASK